MMNFDAIIVGAGPAGSSAALNLARAGKKTLLLERGTYPGSKNLSGAAVYDLKMLEEIYPNFSKEAPIERFLVKKDIAFITEEEIMQIGYKKESFAGASFGGVTVLRSKFDAYLAEEAVKAGATLITEALVTKVLKENGIIKGVIINNQDIVYAPIVIASDGINSFIAKACGLQKDFTTDNFSLGVKEIIALPEEVINERFHLNGNEGATMELVGSVTGKAYGGGFIHTNKDSIAIGVVAQVESLENTKLKPYELLENFKNHNAIAPLIKGGKTIEYGAHLIPEGGYNCFPKLSDAGIMVAGDAAGMVMVTGYLLLGVNYAIESGRCAGETAVEAINNNDYSAESMKTYETKLKECGLLDSFKNMRKTPHNLVNNKNLQNQYPYAIVDIMNQMYSMPEKPMPKLKKTIFTVGKKNQIKLKELVKDIWKMGGSIGW